MFSPSNNENLSLFRCVTHSEIFMSNIMYLNVRYKVKVSNYFKFIILFSTRIIRIEAHLTFTAVNTSCHHIQYISILLLLTQSATTSIAAISTIYHFKRTSCIPSPHATNNTEHHPALPSDGHRQYNCK